MICFPNAKINLGLHVTERRPDGYHNIETIFYPIPLRDALEIVPSDKPSFIQTGIRLNLLPDDNLVMKAMDTLQQNYAIPPSDIYLHKAIPFGAGLGGGSSDAAFMLMLINDYLQLGLDRQELETVAATLGADCPFFICNTPVIATGTGNMFEPLPLSLKGYMLCIVKPDVSVSTREAYAAVKPAKPPRALREIIVQPVAEWRSILTNDFEPYAFDRYPVIGSIKNELYAQGAVYASMSGSGSAVFGLFEKDKELYFPEYFTWKGVLE